MFNNLLFDNSRTDGFPVMEIVPEEGDSARLFVPLRRTELAGQVIGPLADLGLTQIFGYEEAQCSRVIEALYRFPLPGDAAVRAVTVRFGEVVIEAELKERSRAEADYRAAKREGRQAALATRESPDVFTLRVAGLTPGQEVTVETSYVQLARMDGGEWSLRIPLTTSPRYVREDESGSRHAQGQPLCILRDPGHSFALDLRLPDAESITSPTHGLVTMQEADGMRVRLKEGSILPDRDCVLRWRATREDQHPALHIHLHADSTDDSVYFLALVAPPRNAAAGQMAPRETVLLIDHSGSMLGAKWNAADWAVKKYLGSLDAGDSLSVGVFHDTVRWFADRPRSADKGTVEAASKFVLSHRDDGGTNLGVALEQALAQPRGAADASRHVLVLTDAEVSDAGRLVRLAEAESGRADRRRISILCIDAAPNSFLARELAERGGGTATFLTSEPEEEDIATALDRVLEDWSAPILSGLRIEINRSGVQAVGRSSRSALEGQGTAIDLGDLPAGRAVWVAGKIPGGGAGDLAIRVLTADGREVAARRLDVKPKPSRPAIKALFGASRVLALEFLATSYLQPADISRNLDRLGYDPATMKPLGAAQPVYAENLQRTAQEGLKGLLAAEALRYGIACSETAFVAVRSEAGSLIEATVAVPNARPAGWSDQFDAMSTGGLVSGAALARCAAPVSARPFDFSTHGSAAPPSLEMCEMAAPPPMPNCAGPPQQTRSAGFSIGGAIGGMFRQSHRPNRQSPPPAAVHPVFSGAPRFAGDVAVLFDSTAAGSTDPFGFAAMLSRLSLANVRGIPASSSIDAAVEIQIYVDDMAEPRVRVRLQDLIENGSRPLNLRRRGAEAIRVVLVDPNGWLRQLNCRMDVIIA